MNKTCGRIVSAFVFGSLMSMPALGQWLEESFEVQEGWNSIFVTVDPQPARADDLFAGLAIEAVWTRDDVPRVSSGQRCSDDTDPNCSNPIDTQWRVWTPPGNLHEAATNLRVIRGGRVYFVKATQPTTLTLVGRPNGRLKKWRAGFNTAGLHVVGDTTQAPTFKEYLGPMAGYDPTATLVYSWPNKPLDLLDASRLFACMNGPGADIVDPECDSYRFDSDADIDLQDASKFQLQFGQGAFVRMSASDKCKSGQGYFISATTDTVYDGPLSLNTESLRGIDFFRRLRRHQVELTNLSSTASTSASVSYLPSESVPSGPGVTGLPTNPGLNIPVFWLDYGEVVNDGGEPSGDATDMLSGNSLTEHTIALPTAALPHETPVPPTVLTLGVRRLGLPPATLDNNLEGSQYQGLLEIKTTRASAQDIGGFRRVLPLAAQVIDTPLGSAAGGGAGPISRPGLYVGTVSLDKVAWVTAGAQLVRDSNPDSIEIESVFRCNGSGEQCAPDRKLCRGTPSVDASNVACDSNSDCPLDTSCDIIPQTRCVGTAELELIGRVCGDNGDCPGGTCEEVVNCPVGEACMGYCSAGQVNNPCQSSAACDTQPQAGDGFCSADASDSALRPAPYPIDFTIIIHVDSTGVIHKLLTEVSLLSDDQNQLVLATPDIDPVFRDTLRGALVINRERFTRRISTAAYSFDDDLNLVPTGSTLAGNAVLSADHPLNPFFHKYHPDHDCKDARGDLAPDCNQFGESTDIGRNFEFRFDPDPPPGEDILEWGDVVLGGIYTETVSGLYKKALKTQGQFRLRRISDVGVLNAIAPSFARAGR